VAGRNESLVKKATELATKYKKKGKIYGYVKNMDELMDSSDMVIGKPGGLITTECLNTITPLCAVEPIPGQEVKNSLFVRDNKYGFYIESKEMFMDLLQNIDSGKIKLDDYRKNIKKKFIKFSFIDIDKIK
jgi:processive 1,2-diacylglycerol beta-glucosyltransferase